MSFALLYVLWEVNYVDNFLKTRAKICKNDSNVVSIEGERSLRDRRTERKSFVELFNT